MTVDQMIETITFSQPQDFKNRIRSLTAEQLTAIRLSYNYRLLQARIRNMGWPNIILGGLSLLLAMGARVMTPQQAILAFFGLAVVVVSIWSIVAPRPFGFAIWAILLGFAGVWNIYFAITHRNVFWGFLGLLQLWWTFSTYRTFTKNSKIVWPSADSLWLYDALRRALLQFKLSPDDDPDFIRFKDNQLEWQGFLFEDQAVFASRREVALLIAGRHMTTFTFRDGRSLFGNRIAGTVAIGGRSTNQVTMKRVNFPRATVERYNRWKGLSDDQAARVLNDLDLSAKKRLPMRIAFMLVLAAPLVLMLLGVLALVVMVLTYGK